MNWGVGNPGGDRGDIILGLGPLLVGGGVLGIAGPVDGGGEGAAGAVGGDGVVALGGEAGGDISEHEVGSEGWAPSLLLSSYRCRNVVCRNVECGRVSSVLPVPMLSREQPVLTRATLISFCRMLPAT